jgi:hypothetical protein
MQTWVVGKRAMLPENTGIAGSAALAISRRYRSTFRKTQMVLILVADKLAMVTASQNEEAFVYWRDLLNVSGKYFVYQTILEAFIYYTISISMHEVEPEPRAENSSLFRLRA